jgi:hypothetical protein
MDRWIFASVSKHFDGHKGTMNLYIEGMHRDTHKLESCIELRSDGPYYTEISKAYWKAYIEVNVLVQAAKNNQNFHTMRQLTGNVMAIFEACIPVYRYGDGPDDDQSYVGALQRLDEQAGRNNIQVSQFGQIDPVNQLEQAVVEAHYVMFVEE